MHPLSAIETLEPRRLLTTFYVSPSGSDAATGLAAAPFATLQRAANRVRAGDTVIVRAGNYTGFHLTRDGTASARITFKADKGVSIVESNATTPDGINLEGADHVTIEGFKVIAMPRAGIRSVLNRNVIIRRNISDANAYWGILTGFSQDILIEKNTASNSQIEHGIYVSNSGDRPVIRANRVFNNHANGIHMNGDASMGGDGIISGARISKNTIYGNGLGGGSGINADGVQNSWFWNNLLYDNHASGISLYQIDGGGPSTNNIVVNNTIVVASDGRWALNIKDNSTGNIALNNILLNFHSFRGSISISTDSLSGFVSNHNITTDRFTLDDGDSILTLTQWRAQTGQDQSSRTATFSKLFINTLIGDYRLSSISPAANRGTSLHAPADDILNQKRPQGAFWDIGAFERLGG